MSRTPDLESFNLSLLNAMLVIGVARAPDLTPLRLEEQKQATVQASLTDV